MVLTFIVSVTSKLNVWYDFFYLIEIKIKFQYYVCSILHFLEFEFALLFILSSLKAIIFLSKDNGPFSPLTPSMMDSFTKTIWQPYHPWVWPVVLITVMIGHSNPSLFIFAIWRVAGWQRSIKRPPCPEDDNCDNGDEHCDEDNGEDNNDHHRAVETIAVERDGADCYLVLGGRNDSRRDRRVQLLPDTAH